MSTNTRIIVKVVGETTPDENLNQALDDLMEQYDVNNDGRLELEELSHLMSVEDNFMKNFCVSTCKSLLFRHYSAIFSD